MYWMQHRCVISDIWLCCELTSRLASFVPALITCSHPDHAQMSVLFVLHCLQPGSAYRPVPAHSACTIHLPIIRVVAGSSKCTPLCACAAVQRLGYEAYVCAPSESDPATCAKRNIHSRTLVRLTSALWLVLPGRKLRSLTVQWCSCGHGFWRAHCTYVCLSAQAVSACLVQ